jgi:serine/threonine protein kinase
VSSVIFADFGIARAADETRLTQSGNTIGTFTYIAPERLGSRAEEDARADIYSLASWNNSERITPQPIGRPHAPQTNITALLFSRGRPACGWS